MDKIDEFGQVNQFAMVKIMDEGNKSFLEQQNFRVLDTKSMSAAQDCLSMVLISDFRY